jgi:hypothetical protein
MSAVVEKFQEEMVQLRNCNCSMSYFYFNEQPAKRTHRDFLRALLDQLITQQAALSYEFVEEFFSIDPSQLSTDRLQKYARTALASYNTSYLLVDGLNECAKDDATKSVEWLLSLTETGTDGFTTSVRVLVSGQRDGILDVLLESEPSISFETLGHSADIHKYCEEISRKIQVRLETTDELRELIVSRVSGQAQGTWPIFPSQFSGTKQFC